VVAEFLSRVLKIVVAHHSSLLSRVFKIIVVRRSSYSDHHRVPL
jgi:hypothetical protein